MKAQHTRGPWVANTDAHGRGRIYGAGQWLATAWLATGDGNDAPSLPAVANARLIAASPRMFAALVKAREFLSAERTSLADTHLRPDGTFESDAQDQINDYDALLIEVDAAIQQAMGPKT